MKIGWLVLFLVGMLLALGLGAFAAFHVYFGENPQEEILVDIRDRLVVMEDKLDSLETASPERIKAAIEAGFVPLDTAPPRPSAQDSSRAEADRSDSNLSSDGSLPEFVSPDDEIDTGGISAPLLPSTRSRPVEPLGLNELEEVDRLPELAPVRAHQVQAEGVSGSEGASPVPPAPSSSAGPVIPDPNGR